MTKTIIDIETGVMNSDSTIPQKEVDKIVTQFEVANSSDDSNKWVKVRELTNEEKERLMEEYT